MCPLLRPRLRLIEAGNCEEGAGVLYCRAFCVSWRGSDASCDAGNARGGSGRVSGVPEEYQDVVWRAGHACDVVSPSLIAAQADHESAHTWDPQITSSAGARGIAQFMPATWATHGRDGDGDGRADITNGADSIYSQGLYMCELAQNIDSWLASSVWSICVRVLFLLSVRWIGWQARRESLSR